VAQPASSVNTTVTNNVEARGVREDLLMRIV
jgi:hypothetical protein